MYYYIFIVIKFHIAPLDPSFFDVLYSEYVLLGGGTALFEEATADIRSEVSADMSAAEILYGSDHLEDKIFNDLGVNAAELGPIDSIVTGEFI